MTDEKYTAIANGRLNSNFVRIYIDTYTRYEGQDSTALLSIAEADFERFRLQNLSKRFKKISIELIPV